MAAVGLSVLVASALLAVDLGSLFYTKRQLQNVADNAALSAVNDLINATYIATDTAAQNDFPVPGEHGNTLATVTGQYDDTPDASTPGREYQGTFTPGGDLAEQNAVQVTVTTQQPYFFMLGSREISATATATRTAEAGLSIGSGLLDIDTERSILLNGILGGLLRTTLNLSVAAYQGLATAHVNLLDLLKAQTAVGTVEELLALDLKLADLLKLTADALGPSDVAYLTLNDLALQVPGDLNLKLGDLIKLSLAEGNSAASANLNVLQLISMAAQVANKEHFLAIPELAIDLPGLLTLNLALSLIEPPSIAIGPAGQDANGEWLTQAHTAQARLKLNLIVGEMLGGVVNLPLYIELARGDAWLERIECRAPIDSSTVTIGATSGLTSVYIGNVNEDAMTDREAAATITPATILNVLGLVTVTAQTQVDLPGGAGTLAFNGPFDDHNTQRISGLSTAGLGESLSDKIQGNPQQVLKVNLLGLELDLSKVLAPLMTLLTPVLALLDSLLAPVLTLLGLQLGYADVTNFHLDCGVSRLVR